VVVDMGVPGEHAGTTRLAILGISAESVPTSTVAAACAADTQPRTVQSFAFLIDAVMMSMRVARSRESEGGAAVAAVAA
jgi:hypothetical protein